MTSFRCLIPYVKSNHGVLYCPEQCNMSYGNIYTSFTKEFSIGPDWTQCLLIEMSCPGSSCTGHLGCLRWLFRPFFNQMLNVNRDTVLHHFMFWRCRALFIGMLRLHVAEACWLQMALWLFHLRVAVRQRLMPLYFSTFFDRIWHRLCKHPLVNSKPKCANIHTLLVEIHHETFGDRLELSVSLVSLRMRRRDPAFQPESNYLICSFQLLWRVIKILISETSEYMYAWQLSVT